MVRIGSDPMSEDPLALAAPGATRLVLEAHGLEPKRRLGQNFLVGRWVLERILERAEVGPEDVVLEVGPGIGTLTRALLSRARAVVAVEADPSMEAVLADTCAFGKDRLALVIGDAARTGPAGLSRALEAIGLGDGGAPTLPSKLVANLPYGVAATIVLDAFGAMPSIERATVMVQREVADRIGAVPGTKAYGAYTVKLALRARLANRFEVSRREFLPRPHVDSTVVTLARREGDALGEARAREVSAVVDAAFAQRRKTLANSLSRAGYDRQAVEAALEAMGLDAMVRAERLSPETFVELAERLKGMGT